ncbi:MAG TPA: DUF3052 domain-containing protein [Gemmatimonadaceae bacterium]|nr:DUF3052 domain-containing protein [Gemmatimonadaceae bacterium]
MSAGYSGTPLAKKLGIPAGAFATVRAPAHYDALVAPLPDGAKRSARPGKSPRFVHVFATARKDLAADLKKLRPILEQDGVVWVSWPKKSAKMDTDITEDTVRSVALPLGFVDVKVCAVDDTWSGLKLVIRRELRK